MKVLNWGFLSTARINAKIIPWLKDNNLAYAVGSRDLSKAKAYQKQWNLEKAYGSYEELLADPKVDIIYNALPNHLHAEWTLKAIENGKHVLCEKPFATEPKDVRKIIALAKKNDVIVGEGFMYRHHKHTQKIKEVIASGVIGKIKTIDSIFNISLSEGPNIRFDNPNGGGCLWDLGCYEVNLIRYLISEEPQSVSGRMCLSPKGVDIDFTGTLKFKNAKATFTCSYHKTRYEFMTIKGTKGELKIPKPFKPLIDESFSLQLPSGSIKIDVHEPRDPYQAEIENFSNAVLKKEKLLVDLKDAYHNALTLRKLYDSAKIIS
jgi:predicted dehydrogenase